MLKFLATALTLAALAALATPAVAQTGHSAGGQMLAQNSGAGVAGQPGNKNGPAARSPSQTSGAGASSPQAPAADTPHTQDASKVPGLPGNKSGPAVRQPSSSGSK